MTTDILFQNAWIFPVYSFFGWCLEVIFCSVNTGKFVNRGFLNGAACPIYGIGACTLILSLTPVQNNLFLLYFGSVILGSLLELIGGFLLKKFFHMSWWDYCDEPMNIGGYICLKFSLMWGVVGVMLMRVVHPMIIDVVLAIPSIILIIFIIVFYIFFIIDLTVTVLAVLKLSRDIQEISRLSELLQKGSDKIAAGLGDTAIQAADKTKEISGKLQSAVKDSHGKVSVKPEIAEKLNTLLNNRSVVRRRLLNAFPRLKDMRNKNVIDDIKMPIKKQRNKKISNDKN